jgi:hypothetical protein
MIYCVVVICLSFKIESQGYHLGARLIHGVGKDTRRWVLKTGGMAGIKTVGQAEHELQLGPQLEKRKVEVATQSRFKVDVVALELDDVVALAAKVDNRTKASHDIRAMVAATLRCENHVHGTRYVHRLEVLGPACHAVGHLGPGVMKANVAASEIQGWGKAERAIGVQSRLAKHAHLKSVVVTVLVGGDGIGLCGAIAERHGLRPHASKLEILGMSANKDAEMERAQVCIRTVLHSAVLGHSTDSHENGEDGANYILHIIYNVETAVILPGIHNIRYRNVKSLKNSYLNVGIPTKVIIFALPK